MDFTRTNLSESEIAEVTLAREEEIDVRGLSVLVATPCYGGKVPIDQVSAILALQRDLIDTGLGMGYMFEKGNSLIETARNNILKYFLDHTEYNRILLLDDDVIFNSEDVMKLLALSTKLDLVCGVYPARTDNPFKMFLNLPDSGKGVIFNEYGLLKVEGLGLGFTVATRDCIQRIWDACPDAYDDAKHGPMKRVFKMGINEDGHFVGEDISFFKFAKQCGIDAWCDIDIVLSHVGTKSYTVHPRFLLQETGIIKRKESE